MSSIKFAFVGGGNMAEGIIRGMLNNGGFVPEQICVYDISAQRLGYLGEEYGVRGARTMQDAVQDAEVVIFCIQPGLAASVGAEVAPHLSADAIFAPICAGVSIAAHEEAIGKNHKIIRIMPNTMTQTKHGVSAICRNEHATDADVAIVTEVCNAIGSTLEIKEEMFETFTAYGCTGPTFLYMIFHAMVQAGIRVGFPLNEARNMTIENMIGVAMKLQMTNLNPHAILDTMTCPCGTGAEAIYTLEHEGVIGGLMHAVERTCKHANEM